MPKVPNIIECGESGSGSLLYTGDGTTSRSVTLRWLVSGMTGYDTAEAIGKKLAPEVYNGHRRLRLEPQVVGGGWYQITAEYGNGAIVLPPSPGCVGTLGSWEFNIETKTEKATQAYYNPELVSIDGPVSPNEYVKASVVGHKNAAIGDTTGDVFVPDYRGTVNVGTDEVKGVDVPRPAIGWSETWHFPAQIITKERPPLKKLSEEDGEGNRETIEIKQPPLIEIFEKCSCHTNLKKFRGFEPGEVLMGTVRSPRMSAGSSMASITFTFSVSRTKTDFFIGDICVPKKEGWDILDIKYKTEADATALVQVPNIVYVCKVIPPADFSELGIGTDLPQYWLDNQDISHEWDDFVGRIDAAKA